MDSVDKAQAWREARQNIAARKPVPTVHGVNLSQGPTYDESNAPNVPSPVIAPRVTVGFDSVPAGFFPTNLQTADFPPWSGGDDRDSGGWDAGSGAEPTEDHKTARTRREIAEANLAEMREAEERGDLIRVSAVKSALAAAFSTTREALLQLPARLAPLIAADSDPASVQTTLHAEIHHALQDLSGASARLGQDQEVVA